MRMGDDAQVRSPAFEGDTGDTLNLAYPQAERNGTVYEQDTANMGGDKPKQSRTNGDSHESGQATRCGSATLGTN